MKTKKHLLINHSLQLRNIVFLGIVFLAAAFFIAPQNVDIVRAQTGAQCGQGCGGASNTQCASGLTCVKSNTSSGQGICVNPVANTCTASNPCCAYDTLPNPTTKPTMAPPEQCSQECDWNGDGVINYDDISLMIPDPDNIDPAVKEKINFCTQSCEFEESGTPPGETSPVPTGPTSTPGGVVGDCSGPTAGTPDGQVDLQDVEHYRRELTGVLNTLACDFDQSGQVDIIDFTNYLRIGFTSQ